jgi:hypothetical protein
MGSNQYTPLRGQPLSAERAAFVGTCQ